ncbi:MAG: addiction module protein [Campylobacterota bacterium]|nr:addiction module protein [Campylobacterota bacterium]
MFINEIVQNVLELPIDERVVIADMLTQSLNTPNSDIEKNWEDEVNKRFD